MVPSRVVIEVLATFDERVARAVHDALRRGVKDVVIDFTRASKIDPVSLAMLARELVSDRSNAVLIEGLSRQQETLLRYLAHAEAGSTREPIARA
jgi:hypothetical protein